MKILQADVLKYSVSAMFCFTELSFTEINIHEFPVSIPATTNISVHATWITETFFNKVVCLGLETN